MYTCMYIYKCISVYGDIEIWIYGYVYTYMCVCIRVYVYMWICIYIYKCISVYGDIEIWIYGYVYTYMCVCNRVYVYMWTCKYIYKCISVYGDIEIWIYGYVSLHGVATISRLLKITRLFCKRTRWKRRCSAKETYNFKESTNRSHPIVAKFFFFWIAPASSKAPSSLPVDLDCVHACIYAFINIFT